MPFEDYRKQVDRYTNRANFLLKEGEELDHRLQVKLGYRLNINPKIIANKINLRPLLKEFNDCC